MFAIHGIARHFLALQRQGWHKVAIHCGLSEPESTVADRHMSGLWYVRQFNVCKATHSGVHFC